MDRFRTLLRRAAGPVAVVLFAVGLVEFTRPLRENMPLTVIDGVDHSYAGTFADDPAYRELLDAMPGLRARALTRVEQRLGLTPKRIDRLVIRLTDGLRASQPIVTRRTAYVNRRKSQLLTFYLEPILLGSVDVERSLTHELIHTTMLEAMGRRYTRLPRWLREGVATWGAGQLEEKATVLVAGKVYARENPASLIDGMEIDRHTVDDYLEDVLLFEYLVREHGREPVVRAVRSIMRGERYADAFERLTGLPWDVLQERGRVFGVEYVHDRLDRAGFAAYQDADRIFLEPDAERAAEAFQAFLRARPASGLAANATYYLGASQLAAGRFAEAADAFQTVVRAHPAHFYLIDDAQFQLAQAYLRMSDRDRARAALERLLRDFSFANESLRADAHMILGRLFIELDRPAEAHAHLLEALERPTRFAEQAHELLEQIAREHPALHVMHRGDRPEPPSPAPE